MNTLSVLAGLALAVALAGCAGTAGDASEGASTMTPAESTPPGNDPQLPVGEVPIELLEAIVTEAAERAGATEQDVHVIAAERVTWNDGSIGCPDPGMAYTQALVPGYRVVVEFGKEELHFHATESGDFRFCDEPRPPLERNADE